MAYATNVKEGYVSQLDALIGGGAWYVHLYTNDPPVTDALTLADMVEASYADYGPIPLDQWTPAALRSGLAFSDADPVTFTYTEGPPPSPIRGYYITSGPNDALVSVWRADGDPFPLGPDNPVLVISVELVFPVCP